MHLIPPHKKEKTKGKERLLSIFSIFESMLSKQMSTKNCYFLLVDSSFLNHCMNINI